MSHADKPQVDLSDFGRAVEQWRKRQGISQKVLAKLVGTSQSTLNGWLRKGQMPAVVLVIARIMKLMSTNLEDVMIEDAKLEPIENPKFLEQALRGVATKRELNRFMRQQRKNMAARQAEARTSERTEGRTV